MPKKIIFSYNWNGKLNCKAFTTIRLKNDKKYVVGDSYEIWLQPKGKEARFMGEAECVSKRSFHTEKINDFVAYLDTGYNAARTKDIIRRMYKKDNPQVDFILLAYTRKSKEN